MPIYDFQNKVTGEVIEKIFSISSMEQYLKDNPDMEIVISGLPPLIDPLRLGLVKPPTGFSEVLRNIDKRTPGSTMSKYGTSHF